MKGKLFYTLILTMVVYQANSQSSFIVDYQAARKEYLCEVENPKISVWYKLKISTPDTSTYYLPKDEGQYFYLCAYRDPFKPDNWYYQIGTYYSSTRTFDFETDLQLPDIDFWQYVNTPAIEFLEYNECNHQGFMGLPISGLLFSGNTPDV